MIPRKTRCLGEEGTESSACDARLSSPPGAPSMRLRRSPSGERMSGHPAMPAARRTGIPEERCFRKAPQVSEKTLGIGAENSGRPLLP